VTGPEPLLELHDLDLQLSEARAPAALARMRKLGFEPSETLGLERARHRLLAATDRRWVQHYERALQRYGRGVVGVRERVCLGCFVTLPTSAAPGAGESLTLCESCGRILYWR
jgi:predicted  nucleic acid-binding Zn-ribbon protein